MLKTTKAHTPKSQRRIKLWLTEVFELEENDSEIKAWEAEECRREYK